MSQAESGSLEMATKVDPGAFLVLLKSMTALSKVCPRVFWIVSDQGKCCVCLECVVSPEVQTVQTVVTGTMGIRSAPSYSRDYCLSTHWSAYVHSKGDPVTQVLVHIFTQLGGIAPLIYYTRGSKIPEAQTPQVNKTYRCNRHHQRVSVI